MYDYLLYFLIFSFLGWCVEVIFCLFKTGRIINRGLADGPFCPIYGIGVCLSYLLIGTVRSFIILALLSMAVITIVEFLVGLFADRTLGVRLWDYTEERGNILGYVCPRFSIIWGVVSAGAIRLIPRLDPILDLLRNPVGYAVSVLLFIMIVVDEKASMLKPKMTK